MSGYRKVKRWVWRWVFGPVRYNLMALPFIIGVFVLMQPVIWFRTWTGRFKQRVLIVRPDEIGDMVLFSAALKEIQLAFPDHALDLLSKPASLQLLEGHPAISRTIVLPGKLYERVRLGYQILKTRYRVTLCPMIEPDVISGLYSILSASPQRVGFRRREVYKIGKLQSTWIFTKQVVSGHREHVVESTARFLRALGTDPCRFLDNPFDLPSQRTSSPCVDAIRELRQSRYFLCVVGIGASHPFKIWPFSYYLEVLNAICTFPHVRAVLVGSESDRRLLGVDPLPGSCIDLVGKTNLKELRTVIELANLYIGNDSGPMHLAAAAALPTVAVFGPTDSVMFGPYSKESTVIREPMPCSPCSHKTYGEICPYGQPQCLLLLPPERVIEAVVQQVKCIQGTRQGGVEHVIADSDA